MSPPTDQRFVDSCAAANRSVPRTGGGNNPGSAPQRSGGAGDFPPPPPHNFMYSDGGGRQPLKCRFTGRSFESLFGTYEEYLEWSCYISDPASRLDTAQRMSFNMRGSGSTTRLRAPTGSPICTDEALDRDSQSDTIPNQIVIDPRFYVNLGRAPEHRHAITFMPVALYEARRRVIEDCALAGRKRYITGYTDTPDSVFWARKRVMEDFAWAGKKRYITGYTDAPDSAFWAKKRALQGIVCAAQRRTEMRATLGFISAPTVALGAHWIVASHHSLLLTSPPSRPRGVLMLRGGGHGAGLRSNRTDPPAPHQSSEPPPVVNIHPLSQPPVPVETVIAALPGFLQFPTLVDSFLQANARMDSPYEGNAVGVQIFRILGEMLPLEAKDEARMLRANVTAAGFVHHEDTVMHACMDLLVMEHVRASLGADVLADFQDTCTAHGEAIRGELRVECWQFILAVLASISLGVDDALARLMDNVLQMFGPCSSDLLKACAALEEARGSGMGSGELEMGRWLSLHRSGANRRAVAKRAEERQKADEKEAARKRAKEEAARGQARAAQRRAAKLDEARRCSQRLREAQHDASRRATISAEQARLEGRRVKRRMEAAARCAQREQLAAAKLQAAKAEVQQAAKGSEQAAIRRRAARQAAKVAASMLCAGRREACRLRGAADMVRTLEAARSRTAMRSAAHDVALAEAARMRATCSGDGATRGGRAMDGNGGAGERPHGRLQQRRVRQLRGDVRRVFPLLIVIARDEVTI